MRRIQVSLRHATRKCTPRNIFSSLSNLLSHRLGGAGFSLCVRELKTLSTAWSPAVPRTAARNGFSLATRSVIRSACIGPVLNSAFCFRAHPRFRSHSHEARFHRTHPRRPRFLTLRFPASLLNVTSCHHRRRLFPDPRRPRPPVQPRRPVGRLRGR